MLKGESHVRVGRRSRPPWGWFFSGPDGSNARWGRTLDVRVQSAEPDAMIFLGINRGL